MFYKNRSGTGSVAYGNGECQCSHSVILFIILYACAGRRGYQIILRRRSILAHSGSVHMYLNFIYGRWGHIIQQIAIQRELFQSLQSVYFYLQTSVKTKTLSKYPRRDKRGHQIHFSVAIFIGFLLTMGVKYGGIIYSFIRP